MSYARGGSKTVDTITLIGDGWLLGEFVWVVTIRHPGSHFEGTEDRFEEKGVSDPTVLLSNGGLVRVHKVAGRDGYFITNDHATLHDSWKLVAAAIRELIAGS